MNMWIKGRVMMLELVSCLLVMTGSCLTPEVN